MPESSTSIEEKFLNEVEQQLAALKQRFLCLRCDQTDRDINTNILKIKEVQPDIVILGSQMNESVLTAYSKTIFDSRPKLRDEEGLKPLVYHFQNKENYDPGYYSTYCDDYFETKNELLLALTTVRI